MTHETSSQGLKRAIDSKTMEKQPRQAAAYFERYAASWEDLFGN